MKYSSEHLAETMRAKREALNLNQTQFAYAIGSTQPIVSEYECGKKTPSFRTAVKIADALGCSLDELVVND